MNEETDYVKRSQYRTKVIRSLDGDVKIPSKIAKESGIYPNHISAILQQLREHELVECINPEVRKGRLYRLTEKGEKVAEDIKD